MFKIVKVQRINPVTYLLADYRGKSECSTRAVSRDSSGYIPRGKVLYWRGNKIYVT